MKLLSLSLRGARGIRKGLGLDQIDLDLTQFEPGTVAIVGGNGYGKSTLLRSLSPYLSMGLMDGTLAKHFALKDSHRDLTWEHGGHVYRSRILINGVKGGTEAYLYRDGEPVAGPNVTAYTPALVEILGTEDFFLRSAFRDQKAQSFITIPRSERKEFMAELLDFAHLQKYHESAKARAEEIEARIATTKARIGVLEGEAADHEPDLVIVREEAVAICRKRIETLEADLVTLRAQHAEALVSVAVYDQAAKEVAGLREREVAANGARDRMFDKLVMAGNDRANLAGKTAKEKDAETASAEAAAATTTAKRDRAAKIAANRENVVTGLETLDAARAELLQLAADRDDAARYTAWENELKRALAEVEHKATLLQSAHSAKIEALEKTLAGVESQASLTASVPCFGTQLQAGCQLLTRAIEARDSVPSLEADIDALRAVNPLDVPELAGLRMYLTTHEITMPKEVHFNAARHAGVQAIEQAESAKNWPGLLAEADAAADVIAECDARLAEIEAETARRIEAIEARYNADEARLAAEVAALEAELAAAAETCKDLAADLAAAETRVAGRQAAAEAETQLAGRIWTADRNLRLLREDLEAAQRALAEAEARHAAATRAKEEAAALAASIAPDVAEMSEWSLLARALAKDGVQALELDAALPGLEAVANQLLASMPEPIYQIHFDTQRESADAKRGMIEDFRIIVYSGGEEQEMQTLSGGEDVWVNAAIMRAISIVRGRKSGRKIESCFLDEADGALSQHRADEYLQMIRRAHEIEGIHHTFVITHRAELLAHIPQKIKLVPGVGIEIES